ncbi:lamin tail domain-containing protein [Patescibacteria group bacterium]|nr:lamin tail domain-containing protein [Patescibacteria group bacterium]
MHFPHARGRAIVSSLLVWCTLLTLFPQQALYAAPQTQRVLIGEVQWSGSSRSTADEWLELWNISDEPISLAGWSLVGASDQPIYFSETDSIAPRQTFLIANYLANTDKTLLTQTIAVATSSLSLSNDHLLIELRDETGDLHDQAGSGIKPPAGASSPTNTSMIRTASSTNWIWKSASDLIQPGAPDLGTPGVCDACTLLPENTNATATTTTELPIESSSTPSSLPAPSIEYASSSLPLEPAAEEEPETEAEDPEAATDPLNPLSPEHETDPVFSTSSEPVPESGATTGISDVFTSSTPETPPFEHTSGTSLDNATSTAASVEATSTQVLVKTTSTNTVATTTDSLLTTSTATTVTASEPSPSSSSAPATVTTAPAITPIFHESPLIDPVVTEIMAAPTTNQEEWVELLVPLNVNPLRYLDWKLEADGKTVFTFTTSTIQALNIQGTYLLPAWKGSKLKNAGASLRLKRADGSIVQEVRYGNSPRDTSWIRDEASKTWKLTRHITKGASNIFELVTTAVTVAPVKTSTQPKVSTTKSVASSTAATPSKKPAASAAKTSTIETLEAAAATRAVSNAASKSEKSSTKAVASKTTKATPAPKKTTAKKPAATTTKKASTKTPLVIPSSVTHFEQIPPEQLSPRVRVKLQGLVGSTVGIFGKQRFVLLAPDGRGLLVKATTQQPSPLLGQTIEVTGLLFANDEGVQLQMETGDQWKPVEQPATSTPRLVDWNAPGLEDQWSYTKLTGLVVDSRSSSITIEADIGEVTIPIKTVLGYRAQRIRAGDTIEVLGIFDGRSGTWKIQPSRASDIVLLKHPESEQKAAGTSPSNTSLPWNAIGIAIGSIGAVEGIRRWLEKRRTSKLSPKTPLAQPT